MTAPPDAGPTLLPCPICQSANVYLDERVLKTISDYRIRCFACGTEGPKRIISDEAIKAWNRRPGEREAALEEAAILFDELAEKAEADDDQDYAAVYRMSAAAIRALKAKP